MLKSCAQTLSCPLGILFKRSLLEGRVPYHWKEANITPIFKKGSRVEAANYRPVSLTSIVSKVLESLIRNRLMRYLTKENLISNAQHGFVSKKSCTTNLLETLDIVTKSVSDGYTVDVC